MQTENKGPKYCDQCGYTSHTDEVALAACRRLLKLDDLNWLIEDLQLCWEYFREHLPEYALSVGAQERYNEYKMDSETPSPRCVSTFLKAAAFLFYVDAVQQIENAKRSKPIKLAELSKLVAANLKEALQPNPIRGVERQGQTKVSTPKSAVSVRKSGKSGGGKKK